MPIKCGLLTKYEVKMARYWPPSFFAYFMDQDGVEVHKLAKKERGQYQAISTEQAWSIKDLLYGSILPARVANHSAGFDPSCPLTEQAI